MKIASFEKHKDLIDDLKEIIFGGTWALIGMYHEIGKRLSEEKEITKILPRVGVAIGKSETTLWDALRFYKKYPDLDKLPGGKKITWKKIRTQLLSGKPIECSHENKKEITICTNCGKRFIN